MRICILTTGFPRFHGDLFGAFVLEMARALVRRGVEVLVIAPHHASAPRDEVVDGVRVRRFRYVLPARWQRVAYGGGIPTNMRQSWWARLQFPLFLLAFAVAARRWGAGADLYHCQWTMTAAIAWLASLGRDRRIVLSVRGSDMMISDRPLGFRINRWLMHRADAVTAVSEQIVQRLGEHGVAGCAHLVPNGVSDRFQPRDRAAARQHLGLPADRVICLFVGMLVPVKGLDDLLDAIAAIGDDRLLCVLVGDGPEHGRLEERAAQLHADRYRFAGAQPSSDVPAWMDACDMLVLSSLSEGRPNVILEAHASARATVATRVGGTPELIDDGETGLLVEAQDPAGLSSAIRRLVEDEPLRERLGRQARERLLARGLTWEGTAQAMQHLYADVLGGEPCAASSAA